MNYQNGLKTLRARLVEQATGGRAPEEKSLESFVPTRFQNQMPEETPEDLMARSANWMSEIKKASIEYQKAYEELRNKRPQPNPFAAAVEGFVSQQEPEPTKAERTEAFISRRSETSPSTYAPQRSFETPVPIDAEMPNVLDALAAVESKGSGDYAAVGPLVTKGMYKNQRAYGRYQVMEGNIGPWTEAALGRSYTTEEFMASPEVQDAVAAHQLQMAKNKFGTWEDAASVWFSGRPMSKAGNASDGYLTTPEYINKFRRNFKRS